MVGPLVGRIKVIRPSQLQPTKQIPPGPRECRNGWVEFSNQQHGRPAPLSPSWSMSIAPSLSAAAVCCISAVAGTTATRSATSLYTSGKSASGPAQASESS